MSAQPPQGSGSTKLNITIDGPTQGRRYFYLVDWLERTLIKIRVGILIVLPGAVSFFSLKWAGVIVAVAVASYFAGGLAEDFDDWWNHKESQQDFSPILSGPNTELEAIIYRLKEFEKKYWMTLDSLYLYLQNNEIPFRDNLDWIETVSLLNQLSLYVGKRFEEESGEKGKELQ